MKRILNKLILVALLVAILLPSQAFAASKYDLEDQTLTNVVMTRGKVSLELSESTRPADMPVRIIVELYESPIIETATALGKEVEALDEAYIEGMCEDLKEDQQEVIDALTSEVETIQVHGQFVNVYNGLAMTVLQKDVTKVADNPLVKSVSLSNIYDRPEPAIISSSFYTKSDYVHQELGYTGEGMVVAIIDTGIDPSHKDFVIDDGVEVALSKVDVESTLDADGVPLPGGYYSEKVPYGYNYMDGDNEIRDMAYGATMHGMHVSGTVAANGEVTGLAPNAQLLAMKVFGNDAAFESTYGDIIIAAIDDAIALGADVMNLSLGSTASFVDATDPEQMAVTRAVANGIVMSISSGNGSYAGDGVYNDLDLVHADNPDLGVVGAPGLTAASIQVASMNNFTYLYETMVTLDGHDLSFEGYGKDEWDIEGAYDLVALGGSKLGQVSDYDGLDVAGKVVLVSRGEYSFYEKTETAADMGAIGIIVYDHERSSFYYDQGGWSIPFMKISKANGLALEAILEAKSPLGFNVSYGPDGEYLDPVSGQMSSYSSWGTTPDLSFKPEITAPGANVYSTLNDDSYGYMSGTSMSTPHVSGGSTLILERIKKDPIFADLNLQEQEKALLAKNILMNTATPIDGLDNPLFMEALGYEGLSMGDYYGYGLAYASPRQQGAGSMNLANAMATEVVITDTDTGLAKVNIGELPGPEFSFQLNLENYGASQMTYSLETNLQIQSALVGYNSLVPVEVPMTITYAYKDKTYGQFDYIMLEPNEAETIEVSIAMDPGEYAFANENHPNGFFIEGYVTFYNYDEALYGGIIDTVGDARTQIPVEEGQVAVTSQEALILVIDKDLDSQETTMASIIVNLDDDQASEVQTNALTALPLSVPYMAFAGNWSDANGFDKTIYTDLEEGESFYGMTAMMDEDTYFLGYNPLEDAYDSDLVGFSPNGDGYMDQAVPLYSLLRNMVDLSYDVYDEEGKLVSALGQLSQERKTWYDNGESEDYKYHPEYGWDGMNGMTFAEDGQYYYVISGRLTDYESAYDVSALKMEKSLTYPVYLDTVAPVIDCLEYVNGGTAILADAWDEGIGIAYYSLYDLDSGDLLAVSTDGYFDLAERMDRVYRLEVLVEDYAGNMSVSDCVVINDHESPYVSMDLIPYYVYDTREIITYGQVVDDTVAEVTINGKPVEFEYTYMASVYNEVLGAYEEIEMQAGPNEFVYREVYESDGHKTFRVETEDEVGNAMGFTRSFYIDATPPTITSVKDDLEAVVYVPFSTESYDVDLTFSDNFPELIVKVDHQVVKVQSEDFVSYEDRLVPSEYAYQATMTLQEGINAMYVEAIDVTGASTFKSVTVYRLGLDEGNPLRVVTSIRVNNTAPGVLRVGNSMDLDLSYTLADGTIVSSQEGVQISANPSDKVAIDGTRITGLATGSVSITVAVDNALVVYDLRVTSRPSQSVRSSGSSSVDEDSEDLVSSVTEDQDDGAIIYYITDEGLPLSTYGLINGPYLEGYPDGTFRPDGLIKRSEVCKILSDVMAFEPIWDVTFKDLENDHWASAYIATMSKASLLEGYEDGSFKPEAHISGGEMAAILSRIIDLFQFEVPEKEMIYTDLQGHWAEAYVGKIFAYGIEVDDGAMTYEPDALMTRAQVVVMINELMDLVAEEDARVSFTDLDEDHWAYEAIKAASK